MQISDRLSWEFRKASILIVGVSLLLITPLTIFVSYQYQFKQLRLSLNEASRVVSTLVFQNDIELLVRNINFFVDSRSLTRFRIRSIDSGKDLYNLTLSQQGFDEKCYNENFESLFSIQMCRNVISWEVAATVVFFNILVVLGLGFLFLYLRHKTTTVLAQFKEELDSVLMNSDVLDFQMEESRKFYEIFREVASLKERQVKDQATVDLSRKLGHDLRSPVSFLKTVDVSEEMKKEYGIVVSRMESICNDLLSKTKGVDGRQFKSCRRLNLQEMLVELSFLKLKEYSLIQNPFVINCSINLYLFETELYRIFSNIFNNSIEAYSMANLSGPLKIEVSLKESDEFVIIDISDNAGGVKQSDSLNVGLKNFSTKGDSGNGIGLYSAKEYIQGIDGKVQFSNFCDGFKVSLFIPVCHKISSEQYIVLIDDDKYVHHHWKTRLEEKGLPFKGYRDSASFLNDISTFDNHSEFFIDLDINGEPGLSLVQLLIGKGFSRINLCTNYTAGDIKDLPAINSIIGKACPY